MKSQANQTINLSRRLRWLAISLLANLVIIGGVSYNLTTTLSRELKDAFTVDLPSVQHAALLDMYHDAIRANVFHAILVSGSKNTEEVKEVQGDAEEAGKNILAELEAIEALALPEAVRTKVEAAKPHVDAYAKAGQEMVGLALSGKLDRVIKMLPEFQGQFESLEKMLGDMSDFIRGEADRSIEQGSKYIVTSNRIFIGILVFGLLFGALGAWKTLRALESALREMVAGLTKEASTMNSTAGALSASANSLNSSSSQQASALQQTAASVDEITAMVKKTEEGAVHLRDSSRASQDSAAEGQRAVEQMIAAIGAISDGNGRVMEQVEGGNRQLAEIVKVISEIENKTKVINDIVFQTKLLSFNASVEAARAGEHGKGFAVVAEEVGNLAQMSGNAAKEISELLSGSIQKVNTIIEESRRKVDGLVTDSKSQVDLGLRVSQQCGSALSQIVKQSNDVGSLISEITTAIQEQTQGIEEISKAIGSLEQVTHENTTTSSSTSSHARGLLTQAQSLGELVRKLTAMSGMPAPEGTDAAAPARSQEKAPPRPVKAAKAA